MTELSVRRAIADDLPLVLEMVQGLAAHHGDTATLSLETLERDALGSAPWITLLVAESADGLLGYAALCPLVQVQFGVRGMDMHHLFVRSDARGEGVGGQLIDASIAQAKAQGCRYIMVGTHPENTMAQETYRAAGFVDADPPGPRFRIKW